MKEHGNLPSLCAIYSNFFNIVHITSKSNNVFQWVNLFRKRKYVNCPICIGKRKYIALMLSSKQIYEVKSLSQQHLAGFQTKAICLTGAWAVSGALSLYSSKILDHHPHLPTGAGHRLNTRETDVLAPLLKHRRRWKTWVRGGGWCGSAVLGKLRPNRQGATILGSLTLLAPAN